MPETTWTGSLHQTFRLVGAQSRTLVPFLESDGLTQEQVLDRLPYDEARAQARGGGNGRPDPKRYRDAKQVYQTVGLLFEREDGRLKVTDLGRATLRWTRFINDKNSVILAKHAAYALSACQLRNPSGAGRKYGDDMLVFPFQFIWKAMLALDGKISSDELNRALFRVQNEDDLQDAISRISETRRSGQLADLGDEVITGEKKNDRIIPWISLASFGWTLFPDKRGGEDGTYYRLPRPTMGIVREAAQIRHKHRNFASVESYIEYVSRSACLPEDLR
ncbi:hypothetical protein [Chitinimonas lacunae]|uniref:Uncharacterized protein n=1 Tax=Chitinimonas lacunae TaxID=1963018 RepID=A0ABV8MM65_9NEIS